MAKLRELVDEEGGVVRSAREVARWLIGALKDKQAQ